MLYPVTEVFHSLQGEGHFVGYPMTFIRLAGCGVMDCGIRSRCDEAPWLSTETLDERELVDRCGQFRGYGIVCITGGEPADHNLLPLVAALQGTQRYRVHIETSGTKSIDGIPFDWITVSPKVAGYKQRAGHTLKIVVQPEWGSVQSAWDHVQGLATDTNFLHRYLQPISGPDGKPVNLPHVIEMLTSSWSYNSGARWALSVQAHKGWGIA